MKKFKDMTLWEQYNSMKNSFRFMWWMLIITGVTVWLPGIWYFTVAISSCIIALVWLHFRTKAAIKHMRSATTEEMDDFVRRRMEAYHK